MSEPAEPKDWNWKRITARKTAEQTYFEDASGMAIDTMESEMIESCCDGGQITGRCTKPVMTLAHSIDPPNRTDLRTIPVEQPPPTPDNHGPKKPVRKPRVVSVDEFFPDALNAVQLVLAVNDPEKGDSWKDQTVEYHLAHETAHVRQWHRGDTSEQHLVHNAARALQALQNALKEGTRT